MNPGDFSAPVHALTTINQGRTLTIPKVLVNNHQEAKLGSTVQSPYRQHPRLDDGRDDELRRFERGGHHTTLHSQGE